MQRELGKEITNPQQRKAFLHDNADSIEEKGYMKRFTPEELLQMKERLSETAIKINDIEEEKKEVMSEFKDRLKPLEDDKKSLLTGLKNKAEHITERCFKFVDMEAREVGFYNEDGDLIESRPAYADELQGNIFQMARTGTEN
jgi:dynactin complex subunit